MPGERRHESREMREASLRRHAQAVLKAFGETSAPVNLHKLAGDRSEVRIFAKDMRGACDGLLRWIPKCRRFYLYYDQNPYKERFNLAHELAHYFIDEHHHAIRTGAGAHKSNAQSFIGHQRMEAEANLYAAELLIPGFLFRLLDTEPCIDDVLAVAKIYQASLQCAARKIIEHSSIPAAMVVSRGGVAQWAVWNAGLVEHGCWGVSDGKSVPMNSATHRAQTTGTKHVGQTNAGLWFENVGHRMPMREEALSTPGHRSIITLLSET